jgi:structural protein KPP10_ORF10
MAGNTNLTMYSFLNVKAVLNGNDVTGLWEGDDAIEIEERSAVANPMVGADGAAIVSVTADQSVTLRIRLQPNSPIHAYLDRKYRALKAGQLDPMTFSVRDTGNGEGGSSSQVVITGMATKKFGVNADVREWELFAQGWLWDSREYA